MHSEAFHSLPRFRLFSVALLLSVAAWARADDLAPPPPTDFRLSATGGFLYGPAKGFVQVPSGGQPGSTSHNRPRLGEIGIDSASIGTIAISGTWDAHEAFVGAEIIRLGGTGTLPHDLITHGTRFAPGTRVTSDVSLDWYRIGYRHHFSFDAGANGIPQFSLAPYADVVMWNFDYRLRGGGASTSRGYLKPTVQGGVQAGWRPGGGPFSLDVDLSASPPGVSSLPFIAAEHVTASYRFPVSTTASLVARAGVRFEQMNYFDNQRVPNHTRADLGPLLIVGFGVEF